MSSKKLSETLLPILEGVNKVINSSSCCFFVFEKKTFNEQERRNLTIQKSVIEGRYIDVVSKSEEDMQDQAFSKIVEAGVPIYTKKYMSYPLYDHHGFLITTVQLEAKYKTI